MKKIVIALGVVLLASGMLLAQPRGMGGPGQGMQPRGEDCPPDGPRGPMFGDVDRMKQDLGLSADQVQKIQAINQRYKTQHEALHQKLQPLQEKLRTALQADNVNLNEVKGLIQQISTLRGEVWILMVSHRTEINNVLTPQQREKDRTMHRQRMQQCPMRGQQGGPGQGPGHGPGNGDGHRMHGSGN